MKPTQENYKPGFPDKLVVKFTDGDFASSAIAVQDFKSGQLIASLEGISTGVEKAYTSVQCGRNQEDHIELNSDLVYINHSCDPNVAFDLSSADRKDWHIRAQKDIASGTTLTFFYPSTEWDMAQPFNCLCETDICLGAIRGAAHLPIAELQKRGWINPWILALATERDSIGSKANCETCGSLGKGDQVKSCGCKPASP